MSTISHTFDWSKDRFQVFLLSACQALIMSGMSLIMTSTALTGAYLATDPAYATLPLAVQFLGVMLATVPASLLMGKIGRKAGFSFGFLLGVISSLLATYAIFIGSFELFVAASFGLGVTNAFGQYLRFAATEVVDAPYRAKAISYVMAGGIFAAFVGPWLASSTRDYFEPVLFAGGFAAITFLYAASILVVFVVKFANHKDHKEHDEPARPLFEIVRQPLFIMAIISGAFGYGMMSFVMTATPLAMVACGFAFSDAAFVIQWHMVGMFLPSFFTGSLINKFGNLTIIFVGAVLNVVCVVLSIAGVDILNFWFGLVALGIGWNFMFIGGSALLTKCYRASESSKVQAMNDLIVFSTVAMGSFASGAIQNEWGWSMVNGVILLPLVITFIALAVIVMKRPKMTAQA